MKIILTRDSVCMADDCFAPNKSVMRVKRSVTLESLVLNIIDQGYLPTISQSESCWFMKIDKIHLAVIECTGKDVQYLVNKDQSISNFCRFRFKLDVHFEYCSDGLNKFVSPMRL